MAKRKAAVPSLDELIQRTAKLRRGIGLLLRRFPEDHLDMGERIFIRLFDPVWRNTVGDVHGPYERKLAETIRWLGEFDQYLRDLRNYLAYAAHRAEFFRQLPVNGNLRLSAEECIRGLEMQEQMLKSLRDEMLRPANQKPVGDCVEELREAFQRAIARNSVKHCIDATKLNPDTINDFLSGRTGRPIRKTQEILQKYTTQHGH